MNDQVKQVMGLLRNLDEFAASTELSRHWHARWQTLFQSVDAEVQKVLSPGEKKKKKKRKAPDA